MRLLVIPDVHQSNTWKKVFTSGVFKDYDRIIQLGDWFDTWKPNWKDNAPIKNFNEAIDLSIQLGNFDVLLGNHDMSYLGYEHCSGFQSHKLQDIRKALQDAEPYMNICVEHNEWVFSHAGVSKEWADVYINNTSSDPISDINNLYHRNFVTWFNNNEEFIKNFNSYQGAMMMTVNKKIRFDSCKTDDERSMFTLSERDNVLLEQIMKLFELNNIIDLKDYIYKAHAFDFDGFNCYGDDTWQGPLWIRPSSLMVEGNMFFNKQCVGHTECLGVPYEMHDGGGRLVVVDSPSHDAFTEIDTESGVVKLVEI